MKFDKFLRPTLITITAPTCSGKSYILDLMTKPGDYRKSTEPFEPLVSRIVSTTTRPQRVGEVDGFDYHFITMEQSLQMEADGLFAELINFRGTRYGVTKEEMKNKMDGELAPVVLLEPEGLEIYKHMCIENGWDIFKIYVSVREDVRIKRLNERTSIDVRNALANIYRESAGDLHYNGRETVMTNIAAFEAAEKLVNIHTDRLLSIMGDERRWQSTNTWDAIIPGDNVSQAIQDIQTAIKWRNRRTEVPHG